MVSYSEKYALFLSVLKKMNLCKNKDIQFVVKFNRGFHKYLMLTQFQV